MNIVEKIKEKLKAIFSKTKKGVAIGGTVATLGLATGCGADKEESKIVDSRVKIEQEKDFKEQYKYDVDANQGKEQEINGLENTEDVLKYLKNMYIEQYEKMTGDTDLTTADMGLYYAYLQDVYVNQETGEMIQCGNNDKQVEQKLENEGISYTIDHNIKVYQVKDMEQNIIDCVALQNKEGETVPVKVTMNDQFEKSYTSVLTEMGTAIPYGLDYKEYLERGNKDDITVSKEQFIQAVEKFENTSNSQKMVEENAEKGLEHE